MTPAGPEVPVIVEPFEVYERHLPNGMRVWVQPIPSSRSVVARVVVRAGARWEDDDTAGHTHLLEHILLAGNDRWTATEQDAVIDGLGGRSNGHTRASNLTFWAQVPATGLAPLLDWLSTSVFAPRLDEAALRRSLPVVFEERGGRDDWLVPVVTWFGVSDPDDAMLDLLVPGSGWTRSPMGDDDALDRATPEGLHARWARHLGPANTTLLLVGGVTPEQGFAEAVAWFGGRRGAPPVSEPAPTGPPSSTRRVQVAGDAGPKTDIRVGFRTVPRGDPDAPIGDLLADYLRSALFDDLRLDRGLVYGVEVLHKGFSDAGWLIVSTSTEGGDVEQIVALIDAALDAVVAGEVDGARLERVRARTLGRFALRMEDPVDRANWLDDFAVLPSSVLKARGDGGVRDVGAEDVRRFAAEHATQASRRVVVAVPRLRGLGGLWITVGLGTAGLYLVLQWGWRRWSARGSPA